MRLYMNSDAPLGNIWSHEVMVNDDSEGESQNVYVTRNSCEIYYGLYIHFGYTDNGHLRSVWITERANVGL